MSLGQRIRQLRQSRGLTQAQLGGTELSKSFVSLLEKDRTQPSVDTLVLIARRLGTSVDALLGQTGHIPEMVCEGLLALSRNAIRDRQFAKSARLLDAASFLAGSYGLDEASREVQLQEAQITLEQRSFVKAWTALEEAQQASERAKDYWRTGRALLLKGWVKIRQRDFPDAAALLESALLTLRRSRAGRDPARVEALIALGTTQGYMGDYARAIRRYEEAARSEVARLDPVVRGRAFWGIGLAYRKIGNLDAAREYLLQAKDALESAEEVPDFVQVLKNLGQLLFEQGRAKDALRHLHQALRAAERLQMRVIHASTLTEIGRVHLSLRNLEEAEHFAGQALEEARKVGDPVEVAEAQVVLAWVHHQRKDTATAVNFLQEAVGTFKERKMRAKMAEAARELGLLLRARGAHAQAADYLALSLEAEKEVKGKPEVVEVAEG